MTSHDISWPSYRQHLPSDPWFQASFFDRLHHLLHFRWSRPSRPSRSWGHLMVYLWFSIILKNTKNIYECLDSPLLPTRQLLDPHVLKWFDQQIRMAQRQAPRHLQRRQWFWDVLGCFGQIGVAKCGRAQEHYIDSMECFCHLVWSWNWIIHINILYT